MTAAEEAFLAEYKQLCEKHGMYIGSCGCCSSPWIVTQDEGKSDEIAKHIKHLTEMS